MKKRLMLIVIIAIIAFCLPERSVNAIDMEKDAEAIHSKLNTEEINTEEANIKEENTVGCIQTLAITPSASKNKVAIKKQVILNQKGVKITAQNLVYEKAYHNMRFNVLVESKNKAFLHISVEDTSVNGFMYQGGRVNYLLASEFENNEGCIDISTDFLEANGIKTITSIEFRLVAYDQASNTIVFESDIIKINTTTKDKTRQVVDTSGESIFNDHGIKIVTKGWDTTGTSLVYINNLYIENNSSKEIYVSFLPIRGILSKNSDLSCDVMPGKKRNTKLSFDKKAIDGADPVSISFIIYEKNLSGKQIVKADSLLLPMEGIEAPDDTIDDTIKTESIEEQVIYNKGGVTVTALSLEGPTEDFSGKKLNLLIANHSDLYVLLQANDISYNGFMAQDSNSGLFHIKPGEVIRGTVSIYSRDVEQSGFGQIATMEFKLDIHQKSAHFESDIVTIDTSAKKEYIQKSDPQGDVLYNDKNIKIVFVGQENTKYFGLIGNFYFENNSDTKLHVQVRPDPGMIDEDAEDSFHVMPGKKIYYAMAIDEKCIKKNQEEMISFIIYDGDNGGKKIFETEPVKLPLSLTDIEE